MNRLKNIESLFSKFSDLLNPMMIKELRQEIKLNSFAFSSSFILAICTLISIFFLNSESGLEQASKYYPFVLFIFVSLPLCIFIPVKAFRSFNKELEAKMLELILLSSISPWKCIFGKWASYVAQNFLLTAMFAPFFVLLFYFTNENPFITLFHLGLIFLFSTLFIAIAICGSAVSYKRGVARRGISVFGGSIIVVLATYLERKISVQNLISDLNDISSFDMLVSLAPLYVISIATFIEVGAGLIAPEIQNSAKRKVFFAIIILFYCIFAAFQGVLESPFVELIVISMTGVLSFTSLSEKLHPVFKNTSSREIPDYKIFYYPGWPFGTLYSCIFLISLLSIAFILSSSGLLNSYILIVIDIVGAISMTVALLLIIPERHRNFIAIVCINTFIVSIGYAARKIFRFKINSTSVPLVRLMLGKVPLFNSAFPNFFYEKQNIFTLQTLISATSSIVAVLFLLYKLNREFKKRLP